MGKSRPPRERHTCEYVYGWRGHAPLQPEEPLLHCDSGDPAGHQVATAEQGDVPARPGFSERLQLRRHPRDCGSLFDAAVSLEQRRLAFDFLADGLRSYFGAYLVAVR